ncbi:MAG: serine hydrolase domain-containing protein [Oligoflexales bacterium]
MISEEFHHRAQEILSPYLGDRIPCASVFVGRLDLPDPPLEYQAGRRGLFDLASLTKALVTAPLVHNFFDYKKNLGDYTDDLPDRLACLNIENLLQHCSGLPWWSNFWINHAPFENHMSWQRRRIFVLKHLEEVFQQNPPAHPPRYSDVGYVLLGLALEKFLEQDLKNIFENFLLERGSFELMYHPPRDEALPTAYCPISDKRLFGEPHDENVRSMGGVSGHAGLFGTPLGVWKWLRFLCSHSNAFFKEGCLGWQQAKDFQSAATFGRSDTFGHLGFTGTSFWVCPSTLKAVVFLSNRVYSQRQSPWMTQVRQQISILAEEAL